MCISLEHFQYLYLVKIICSKTQKMDTYYFQKGYIPNSVTNEKVVVDNKHLSVRNILIAKRLVQSTAKRHL